MKNYVIAAALFAVSVQSIAVFAEVESVQNSLFSKIFTQNTGIEPVVVFIGKSNKIKAIGDWLDITSSITIRGSDVNGNTNTTSVAISRKGKDANGKPFVEFTLNQSSYTGRCVVRLERSGFGSSHDVITVFFTKYIQLNTVQPLTISNTTPAYLNAFPVQSDIRLRLNGIQVDSLTFKPRTDIRNFISATDEILGTPTGTQKDMRARLTARNDFIEFKDADFTFRAGSFEYRYSLVVGALPWQGDDRPFVRAYDKPDFKVENSVRGLYNANSSIRCLQISNGNNRRVETPSTCSTGQRFAVPDPTLTNPVTQATVTMPNVVFTIFNDSYAPQFSPVTVSVRDGVNTLATLTIDRMIAKEKKEIIFKRKESRKIFSRTILNPGVCNECYEVLNAPFDWFDPAYTVIVDVDNKIAELSENNNSFTFPAGNLNLTR